MTQSKLTDKELSQVKDLAYEIKNQDLEGKRWGAAKPLKFWLQNLEEFKAIDDGEYLLYNYKFDAQYRGNSARKIFEEIEKDYKDNGEEIEERGLLLEDIELNSIHIETKYITHRVFLTHKAAKKHLEQNYYHYSPKARILCHKAWRNPEAELVEKLILSFLDEKEVRDEE